MSLAPKARRHQAKRAETKTSRKLTKFKIKERNKKQKVNKRVTTRDLKKKHRNTVKAGA